MRLKRCPTCNRTFSDEALSFCLIDGSILSAPYDPKATLVLSDPHPVSSTPTEIVSVVADASKTSNIELSYIRGESHSKVKWYWYILALVLGAIVPQIILALFMQMTTLFLRDSSEIGDKLASLYSIPITALVYCLLGFGFGYVWPQLKWRWSIWLSSPTLILLSLIVAERALSSMPISWLAVIFILVLVIAVLGTAILGSYWGAIFSLRQRPNNSLNPTSR